MKEGILSEGFTFYTVDGEKFSVDKGTRVVAKHHTVYFIVNPDKPFDKQLVKVVRHGEVFVLYWFGKLYLLKPFEPEVPYPLSMVTPRDFSERIAKGVRKNAVINAALSYFGSKLKNLKNKIKKIEKENERRKKRMEISELAKRAANFFNEQNVKWAYHD